MQILTSIIFLICSASFAFWCYQLIRSYHAKNNWLKTDAEILNIVIQEKNEDGEIVYYPSLEYRYKILANTYLGSRIAFTDNGGFSSNTMETLKINLMEVGCIIPIYYNSKNHNESIVYCDITSRGKAAAFMSFISACFAIFAFKYW